MNHGQRATPSSRLKFAIIGLALLNAGLLAWIIVNQLRPAPSSAVQTLTEVAPPMPPASPPSPLVTPPPEPPPEASATTPAEPDPNGRSRLLSQEEHIIALFEKTAPSVTFITTQSRRQAMPRGMRSPPPMPSGAGSGFVWDSDGHVVTNFHVIADASEATVTLSDGTEWPARLVGAAPDADLAVLKIAAPAERLSPIPRGTARTLRVGQFAMAIGNPFGLDQTLTTGIISALDREIESISGRKIYGVVQTDAAINPGNSGGPLLDSSGRLIGVNTAIRSASGSSAGIGFAVPADTVARVVPQLIEHGRVARPGLGVFLANPTMARSLGAKGAVIRDVQPGSPAARAGLGGLRMERFGRARLGDVIVAVDETPVQNANDLLRILDGKSVGDGIRVAVEREGVRREVRVTLAALE